MRREAFSDLLAFLAVAEERSFTRAAARLETSQSALSHTIRRLETQLGLRLLNRTTRSVAPTEAGEQLIQTLRPALDGIDAKLAALSQLQIRPAGTVRITSSQHAALTVLWPAIAKLLPVHPALKVEISIDAALTDIVSDRYDAGVRLGESIAKDMIAIRIGPDLRMAVVGAPSYLAGCAAPKTPHDLTQHKCINIRLPTAGSLYTWEFAKNGRKLNVRVDGPLVFNDMSLVLKAATEGLGLACTLEDQAEELIAQGKLVRLLEDWCPAFAGYHLYYPSQRQISSAFALLVESLRYPPRKSSSA
ncbi:LysR family transcriptional regulator [Burkholderia diffusa]|uniref:LysR family transcriptional regulator n=1 Tax=Burkholderia diffusa TaxID=488732 RepID=A0AAW3PA12_9BURK|nr:LysR family transcriptional regulator [Burkholderia diffusa]KWF32761.1 LysR family transcriptional regulator [Burkholderia diffusa]KWF38685.1 LysR family transcriptional regulator [Burkholderia diffusa]KWF46730.1 LysR family transcriptional regulator [Burkholderia diffusa]KWF50699.1 LysR family transcriptional regulator [Burkholderia diffusa]